MYELLGGCLTLALLLTINALASLMIAGLWRGLLRRGADNWSAASRAQLLFALRLFPFIAALLFVVALALPSYLLYEPLHTDEVVSGKLAALASISAFGISLALWRGFVVWRATRRLVADWMRHAEPMLFADAPVPVYRVRHRFPLIAVVGAARPRLFIASHILDTLNADELRAAIAHECGHLVARDNLKRALLRACRDMLTIVPMGRTLDRAWTESAEAAADEYAAGAGGANSALDLASALVKIARLVPLNAKPSMPAGSFLIEEAIVGGGSVEWRVRRLVQLAALGPLSLRRWERWTNLSIWIGLGMLICGVVSSATSPHVLALTHVAVEMIVNALK